MIRIDCPNCGLRDHTEFTYVGDATRTYPGLEGDMRTWVDYVFLRDNPRGRHKELWHHVQGCRRILQVERDTVTHEVFSVSEAATPPARTAPDNSDAAETADPPDALGSDAADPEAAVPDTAENADEPDVAQSDGTGSSDDA